MSLITTDRKKIIQHWNHRAAELNWGSCYVGIHCKCSQKWSWNCVYDVSYEVRGHMPHLNNTHKKYHIIQHIYCEYIMNSNSGNWSAILFKNKVFLHCVKIIQKKRQRKQKKLLFGNGYKTINFNVPTCYSQTKLSVEFSFTHFYPSTSLILSKINHIHLNWQQWSILQ